MFTRHHRITVHDHISSPSVFAFIASDQRLEVRLGNKTILVTCTTPDRQRVDTCGEDPALTFCGMSVGE